MFFRIIFNFVSISPFFAYFNEKAKNRLIT